MFVGVFVVLLILLLLFVCGMELDGIGGEFVFKEFCREFVV